MRCVIGDWEYGDDIIRAADTIISRGSSFIKLRLVDTRGGELQQYLKHPNIPVLLHTISFAKRIYLFTSSSRLFHNILESSAPFFPALEEFSISSSDGGLGCLQCTILNNAPRLINVHIAGTNMPLLIAMQLFFEPPFAQLQDIHIVPSLSLLDAYSILSRCPRLRYCALQIANHVGSRELPRPFPRESITLPYLLNFSLRFNRLLQAPLKAAPILELLVLPSLRILSIHPASPDDRWCTGLTNLLERSRCPLVKIIIQAPEVPEGALDLLWGTISPTLEVLEMTSPKFSIELLARIAQGTSLPRLQILECGIDSTPAALEGVTDLMRNRCLGDSTDALSCIQAVGVHPSPHIDAGMVAGWHDAVNRFNVVAQEMNQKRRVALLQ